MAYHMSYPAGIGVCWAAGGNIVGCHVAVIRIGSRDEAYRCFSKFFRTLLKTHLNLCVECPLFLSDFNQY
jgi:hypothetical protein